MYPHTTHKIFYFMAYIPAKAIEQLVLKKSSNVVPEWPFTFYCELLVSASQNCNAPVVYRSLDVISRAAEYANSMNS